LPDSIDSTLTSIFAVPRRLATAPRRAARIAVSSAAAGGATSAPD
jgi:hypothetical protein